MPAKPLPAHVELTKKVRKRRDFCARISDEVEKELGEWYKDNSLFYNKGLRDYKNTEKKNHQLNARPSLLISPLLASYVNFPLTVSNRSLATCKTFLLTIFVKQIVFVSTIFLFKIASDFIQI